MSVRQCVAVAVALVCVSVAGGGQTTSAQGSNSAKHVIVPAADVKYGPIEVPGFPTGLKIAVIYGDPNAASGSYVLRLQFPAGYKFPAHWHPNAENLTVISGEFLLGMGNKEDAAKIVSYKPGTFMYIPGKEPHFGGVKAATVVQLHGEAPFKIELVKSTTQP